MGAAYGTAKSGVGVASMGVMWPELVMKSIVPVVMAGVLGIYGLIIAVIISTGINPKAKPYFLFDGYTHLSSGLACGLAGLAAGMAIGIVGDAGVRYTYIRVSPPPSAARLPDAHTHATRRDLSNVICGEYANGASS
jgi:V-type H+-transporting ATPase 16kDa proteolipid subunit